MKRYGLRLWKISAIYVFITSTENNQKTQYREGKGEEGMRKETGCGAEEGGGEVVWCAKGMELRREGSADHRAS